jgi:hypothetical protein
VCAVAARAETEAVHLAPYSIPDQFDAVHTDDEVEGSVVIYFRTDRKSWKYNSEWIKALQPRLGELPGGGDVVFLYLANLKGVPGFLKKMIKKKFPQDPSTWMLLDWKGAFADSYGFTKGALNLLVFNSQGLLVYRAAVNSLDTTELEKLVAALTTALEDTSTRGD